jgi:hypothetical protein
MHSQLPISCQSRCWREKYEQGGDTVEVDRSSWQHTLPLSVWLVFVYGGSAAQLVDRKCLVTYRSLGR